MARFEKIPEHSIVILLASKNKETNVQPFGAMTKHGPKRDSSKVKREIRRGQVGRLTKLVFGFSVGCQFSAVGGSTVWTFGFFASTKHS